MVRLLKLPGGAAASGSAASAPPPHGLDGADTADGGGLVLKGHTGTVRDICYPSLFPTSSPPGTSSSASPGSERLLSVGAGDFACRVWDVRGGAAAAAEAGGPAGETGIKPLVVFRGHTDTVFSCSMLPGGDVRSKSDRN